MADEPTTEGDAMSVGENMAIWTCKIGWAHRDHLPSGSDGPMRVAVERAFKELTGYDEDFTFSGWGGRLTSGEQSTVDKSPNVFIDDEKMRTETDPQVWAAEVCKHFYATSCNVADDISLMNHLFSMAIEAGRRAGIAGGGTTENQARLVEAIRLTVEYVGMATLPPIDGWSWYDAWKAVDPEGLENWLDNMPVSAGGRREPMPLTDDTEQVPG